MLTKNQNVLKWVDEMVALCKPDEVVWIDGSDEQLNQLRKQAEATGEMIALNQEKLPGCYLHRTAVNDVARVEGRTFICSRKQEDAGPTNNWCDPKEMYAKLTPMYDGVMKGRTMYVIPYSMGPIGSPMAKVGVELTDSIYVVLNMDIMTRMGKAAFENLGDTSNDFVRGLHSKADIDEEKRYICHFPEDNTIWSINSGYGGNVLLGKKCFALRIASYQGKNEGWMAEHMLILGIQNPKGEVKYITAAFPSACGKTNLAMLIPPEVYAKDGYKVWCVGDDIAWLRQGEDGRLWAINPENGFFGVAPGTNATRMHWLPPGRAPFLPMLCIISTIIPFGGKALTRTRRRMLWIGLANPGTAKHLIRRVRTPTAALPLRQKIVLVSVRNLTIRRVCRFLRWYLVAVVQKPLRWFISPLTGPMACL